MGSKAMFAEVAALAGDPARAGMLHALMDGRALSASELARVAGVTPQTATGHLARMTTAGLLCVEKQGRHRYHRLATPAVAQMIESIMQVASALDPARPKVVVGPRDEAMRIARTCYDHIAGRLGVGIMTSMLEQGRISGGDGLFDRELAAADHPAGPGHDLDYELTDDGRAFLDRLGVRLPEGRRALVRYCVDWTETRHHLAGRVGRGLRDRFLEAGWLERRTRHRALRITEQGAAVIKEEFGLDLPVG
jgi:DNA-binding transcriptional ArsR family regulator